MRVAMHDGRISPALGQREQARRAVQQRFEEVTPLPRQAVAEAVGELRNFFCETAQESADSSRVAPAPY
jgi:hypothetical protein